jgi:hypothetical protein
LTNISFAINKIQIFLVVSLQVQFLNFFFHDFSVRKLQ